LKIYIICINDEIEINQLREERENPTLQTKEIEHQENLMKRKLNKFCNICKLKEKNGILIIEMHFVGLLLC